MKGLMNSLLRLSLQSISCVLGIGATIIVLIHPYVNNSVYFLIPLFFTAFMFLMGNKLMLMQEGGIGLKILLIAMAIRYCVSPIMNAVNGNYSYNHDQYYDFAVLIQIVEMFTIFLTLYHLANKYNHADLNEDTFSDDIYHEEVLPEEIHFSGLLVILGLIAIIILRNNGDEIWSSMRFFIATTGLETDASDGYSIIAIQCIKNFLCIVIISAFKRRYDRSGNKIYVLLSLAIACLGFMIYFGYNRSSILQNAFALIIVVLTCFKREKKFIITLLIPIIGVMTFSLIMLKQYGVDITSGNISGATNIQGITQTIDAYFCGINNVAEAYRMYGINGSQFGLFNFCRDITDNFFLFKVPGFTFINSIFSNYNTVVSFYAQGGTSMLSVAGQTLYYGGYILGWLFDIFAHIFVINILIKCDRHVKTEKRLGMLYFYSYVASIFGMIPMYCLITLLWSFSGVPFFILILLTINYKGRRIIFGNRGNVSI